MPKINSNCYFLILVTPEGIQPPLLKCAGAVWTGSNEGEGGQTVFSPDLKKYIRFNAWNGLNIFDFDNETGDLSNPIQIMLPEAATNYIRGTAVSPNSRFIYVPI